MAADPQSSAHKGSCRLPSCFTFQVFCKVKILIQGSGGMGGQLRAHPSLTKAKAQFLKPEGSSGVHLNTCTHSQIDAHE